MQTGKVVWFTGLSGAGKSTLCMSVSNKLANRMIPVHVLDADLVRQQLCRDLGFSMADRLESIRRIAFVSKELMQHGIVVLVAAITPLESMRSHLRNLIPDILQVYVDAPFEVCEIRDPKGLYKRARKGELDNFTGLTSPFEVPLAPDLVCETHENTIEQCVSFVFDAILESIGLTINNDLCDTKRRPTIAVDFDGVIAEYSGWRGPTVFGSPRSDVKAAISMLKKEGWKIIIHTTRSTESVQKYLNVHSIAYDEINSNSDYSNLGVKPVATVYWDDRALRYSGNANQDLESIRNFMTWSGRK